MHLYLLFGLIVAVTAEPQGYNYNIPQSNYLQPPRDTYLPPSQQYLPPPIPRLPSNTGYDYSPPFGYNSFNSGGGNSFNSFHSTPHHHHHQHQEPIITKHFYFHSAPEERTQQHRVIRIGQPRRNYRVIFIKAPSQLGQSSISVVPPQNEERTVIYVLSKQADASDIKASVQDTPTIPSKPEVFFIKYKTPDEAALAQRQIQAQFETLGGSTQISNEGTAPVSSVIGSTRGAHSNHDNFSSSGSSISSSSSRYLPPSQRYRY